MLQCFFHIKLTKLKKQSIWVATQNVLENQLVFAVDMFRNRHGKSLEILRCFRRGHVNLSLADVHFPFSSFALRCSSEKVNRFFWHHIDLSYLFVALAH